MKNSLIPFWGHWGQEAILEAAKDKFCFSSAFYGFSFRIFVALGFDQNSTSNIIIRPQWPQKRLCQIFQKLHQIATFLPSITLLGASKLIRIFLPDMCVGFESKWKIFCLWKRKKHSNTITSYGSCKCAVRWSYHQVHNPSLNWTSSVCTMYPVLVYPVPTFSSDRMQELAR